MTSNCTKERFAYQMTKEYSQLLSLNTRTLHKRDKVEWQRLQNSSADATFGQR